MKGKCMSSICEACLCDRCRCRSVNIYRTKDIARAIGQLSNARELIAMAASRLPTSSERDELYRVTSEPIKAAMSSLLNALMKAEGI